MWFTKKKEHTPGIPCLVCGFLTIEHRGAFEICPICFWEDEGDIDDPNEPSGGPNGDLSLNQAKRNYESFGAVEKRFIKNVRRPFSSEMP